MIFLGMNQNDPSNEHDKTGEKGSQIHHSMLFLSLTYSSPIYCTFSVGQSVLQKIKLTTQLSM